MDAHSPEPTTPDSSTNPSLEKTAFALPEFDLSQVSLVGTTLLPLSGQEGAASPPTAQPSGSLLVDELVEDMLAVMKRLQSIEEGLAHISGRIDQVDARVYETGRALGTELAGQRRDLLGDRKGAQSRGVFNAVVGQIDSLRAMRAALEVGKEQGSKHVRLMVQQIQAVETMLFTVLQQLGYQEFNAKAGEPFTPTTMTCLGYAEGPQGVVLGVMHSGFNGPDGVARPASVLIARPTPSGAGIPNAAT